MEYLVEVIGFPAAERALFASTFSLSARRETSYCEYRPGMPGRPDLYLVDAEDAFAMQALEERGPDLATPAVLVGKGVVGSRWLVISRPIRWLHLFKALDESLESALKARAHAGNTIADFAKTLTYAELHEGRPPRPNGKSNNSHEVKTHIGLAADSSARTYPDLGEDSGTFEVAQLRSLPPAEWVLVVDDNLVVRKYMAQKLAPFNINVDFAETGEQAIGLTGTKHYTCVFLDVVMPGIDGYQVCKVIKSKKGPKTAVIILTSKDSPLDKLRGKLAGCDAYLTKPVEEERLMQAMSRFLPGMRDTLFAASHVS